MHSKNLDNWSITVNNQIITPGCELCYEHDHLQTTFSKSIKKRLAYLILSHPGVSLVFEFKFEFT